MALNPRTADWAGKTAWLVGASSGIGLATAKSLHARGARVVVSARTAEALHDFVAAHPGSEAIALDVSDHAALCAASAEITRRFGGIDLVMYCAGTYTPMRATAFDLPVALRHQQVNVHGALLLLDAVLPQLLKQADEGRGGHLSLVSSVAGYRGLPQGLAYGPTKAALIHLAETLYLDLQPVGLGVSLINPGFVATALTAQNDFAMPALMTPQAAAEAILRGWARGEFEIHFPKRFTRVLGLLRCLPYSWYFRAVSRLTGL
jgi:NAD(P)-dependent dehydrogenase (short-subunit alcohol dehydrogenase family)